MWFMMTIILIIIQFFLKNLTNFFSQICCSVFYEAKVISSLLYEKWTVSFISLSLFPILPTAIGNAFAVLSDADKRRRYDQYGDENPQPQIYRDHYDYGRGFEGL